MEDRVFLDIPKPIITNSPKKRKRSASKLDPKLDEEKSGSEHKKIMHRDIERQRRQEMSTLYASLRDLLPLEYIKGRRSVSDHMHEAANYIKHMEKNIKELKLRRDKLGNASNSSSGSENGSSNGVNLPNFVTVNCGCDGVEILINCGIKEGYGFSLPQVLVELIQTGLDTVGFISNRVNGRFLYKIQTQVNPLLYIDLPELQNRLENVINKDCSNLIGVDFFD